MSDNLKPPTPKEIRDRILIAMRTANVDDLPKLSSALKDMETVIHGSKAGAVDFLERLRQLVDEEDTPDEQETQIPEHLKTTDE